MEELNSNSQDRREFLKLTGMASAAVLVGSSVLSLASCAKGGKEISALDICFMSAKDLSAAIQSKELSAVQVMNAFYDRIELVNPKVNALVSLLKREEAVALAQKADEELASGKKVGKLHGFPWCIKDMEDAKGFPTTRGCVLFKDYYPKEDDILASRIRGAGAIIIGKSNVPEFAAGSNTFNPVFGATLNPYDLKKTCGGSTGGGAVAIATGMMPICDGSDAGGSLRNPAAWCNVVGLRPSMGRVPYDFPVGDFIRIPTNGVMGRTAEDAAFLLSVVAGRDYRDPVSIMEDPEIFAKPLDRDFKGTKIAYTTDLGYLEIDKEIVENVAKAKPVLKSIGCEVTDAYPVFKDVFETNKTLRSLTFSFQLNQIPKEQHKLIKEPVRWEAELGNNVTTNDIMLAQMRRANICKSINKFLEEYEFLVLPVTQVMPFNVELPYPADINGKKMNTYLEWMEVVYWVSLTGLPAVSVPCAFSKDGLPVGLQIVGRRNDDLGVLQLAHAFEKAAKVPKPIVPKI